MRFSLSLLVIFPIQPLQEKKESHHAPREKLVPSSRRRRRRQGHAARTQVGECSAASVPERVGFGGRNEKEKKKQKTRGILLFFCGM